MMLNLSEDWSELLLKNIEPHYFKEMEEKITEVYSRGINVFPPKNLIFEAFNRTAFEEVKIVILGQDPYPTKGHANGLSFSVNKEVKPFPKSLLNIFKTIEIDLGIQPPENGDLGRWADQGVLLLNSILTVEEGNPLSHKNLGWQELTNQVIDLLSKKGKIVFMLWGKNAIELGKGIDADNNLVLTSVHPSPLSAYRGFFECAHFSKANEYLIAHRNQRIEW